jgi:hypothetical protein
MADRVSLGAFSQFRDLSFVQQLLILNTLLFWLHPTDLDKQGL